MKKETTKKEKIVNGVLLVAGIGVTICLGTELVKHGILIKRLKDHQKELDSMTEKLNDLTERTLEVRSEIKDLFGAL